MDNKKILIATGGTGGHVFPAYALSKYLIKNRFSVEIVTDKRGFKFLSNYKDIKIKIITSATIFKKNPFKVIFSFLQIILAFIYSTIHLLKTKPKIVFGMGGYASFPICIASKLMGIPFITYENNLHLGRANKYLLPLAYKMFIAYSSLEGIKKQYNTKIVVTGNIIREEILNYKNTYKSNKNEISILILGGSQAAKIFAEKLPMVFESCKKENMNLTIFQQCLKSQSAQLEEKYKSLKINFKIFNFSYNLLEYFSKVDVAITRAGSSMLAELLNCKVPIISVPLPTSADNHQLKNAKFFEKNGYGFLIEEKQITEKLFPLIKSIHKDKSLLDQVRKNQKYYSDEKVFDKILSVIKEIVNE